MYDRTALLDVHERTHRSFARLLEHLRGLAADDLARPLEGFGYATILRQLHHMVGAEQYWIGVLQGRMLTDELEADRVSLEAVEAFRTRTVEVTRAYLDGASPEELNTARALRTWNDRVVTLVPARVLLRTQTHVFQHLGQVTAMSRLLGHPVPPGIDFPLS